MHLHYFDDCNENSVTLHSDLNYLVRLLDYSNYQ